MFNLGNISIIPFFAATLVSYFLTPVFIKLLWKLKIVDDPKYHKAKKVIHKEPIPRGGGVIIFLSILVSAIIFLPLDKHLVSILAGLLIITTMGLLDDYLLSRRKEFSPYIRLAIQFTAAAIPIAAGIGISFVSDPRGGIINLAPLISDLFALFWIVTLMNFVNIGAKGVDGQLTGITVISALTIAALSLRFSADIAQWPVIILASITAGAFFGFFPYHVYPQKIMPSFSGSNIAGFMLAILSILSTAKVGTLAVVLAVPLIDTGYVIVRRLLSGKSPVWGDNSHLHHRLLQAGWNKSQVAIFYWVVTAILGIVALNLNTQNKLYTIVGVGIFLGGLIIWLTYRPRILSKE